MTMPLSDRRQTFTFPALPKLTYFGLPSMLADALPDDFGNALIDAWMATKGSPRRG
jgi:serine/threonine-protein kinase HipA